MDFWRCRGSAYLVGAVEFTDNLRLNILDGLHLSHQSCTDLDTSFQGRVCRLCVSVRTVENVAKSLTPFDVMQTCIVTGANAGIGLAFSTALAQRGARVILACRSLKRGRAAAQVLPP